MSKTPFSPLIYFREIQSFHSKNSFFELFVIHETSQLKFSAKISMFCIFSLRKLGSEVGANDIVFFLKPTSKHKCFSDSNIFNHIIIKNITVLYILDRSQSNGT